MKYADVIVDISAEQLDRHFQYRIPEELEEAITPGVRVEIPFGKGNAVRMGYVIRVSDKADYDPEKIKTIRGLFSGERSGQSRMIELAVWIKNTYGCTMIQALKTVLPVQKTKGRSGEKVVERLVPAQTLQTLLDTEEKKSHKARARFLQSLMGSDTLLYRTCTHELKLSAGLIRSYEEQGVIRVKEQDDIQDAEKGYAKMPLPVLTGEQSRARDEIVEEWKKPSPRPILLKGVTGSGKTILYMSLIADTLRQGKQAILLVPEIALTYQNVRRFYEWFQDRVAIIHSRLSPGERARQFERARTGSARIMIGPRSALFAPFEDLGLIIVDEEQESSYHSEMTPRYHARETAVCRGRLENARVVLGSATPSLEANYRAREGIYKKVELKSRYGMHGLPKVFAADMREELKSGNRSIFSRQLMDELEACLARKEQALLFLNKRGYAGFISCRMCGYVVKCRHCDVAMTMHRNGRLICHYCGRSMPAVNICPVCQSPYISGFRAGTQQVEELLQKAFPNARILRMDMDTTRHKNDHEKIVKAFYEHEADILIGTQMIVKGHDFPDVTLVGALAADMSLFSADYRSAERTFQLLTQAVGRAGRAEKKGCAVIQTYHPDHYAIQLSIRQDYDAFYEEEIGYRKLMGYPPTAGMLAIHASCDDEEKTDLAMDYLRQFLEMAAGKKPVQIIGPADETVAKINDMYRRVLYVKSEDERILIALREKAEQYIQMNSGFDHIYMQYDFNA